MIMQVAAGMRLYRTRPVLSSCHPDAGHTDELVEQSSEVCSGSGTSSICVRAGQAHTHVILDLQESLSGWSRTAGVLHDSVNGTEPEV